MIAKKKKAIITGVIIVAVIAILCGILVWKTNNDTDYVFEGTFVQENLTNEQEQEDCFKRNIGEQVFI
ncbi:hypothetical protein [Anaerosporobacter faecicola]|uniref:hypothetical protein n=1 Tax=Anaerosporobacter faecicola TaxID=2718714 RepID=UPI001439FF6E|nr:hypothetical protein [Anaerosporobacter faecicola]